jgi:hypothetical protein
MTGWREYFFDLDSGMRDSVKFGDASAVEIKGVGSVVFTAKTGEHRLLTGVYCLPALRNSSLAWDNRMRTAHAWRSIMGSYTSRIGVAAFLAR